MPWWRHDVEFLPKPRQIEHGIDGTACGGRILRRRYRLNRFHGERHFPVPRLVENGHRETVPSRLARAGGIQDAAMARQILGRAAVHPPHQFGNDARQCGRRSGCAFLIVDDPDRLALRAEAQHGAKEILSPRRIDP